MISKPFDKPKPNPATDPRGHAGWEAEQNVAFELRRAFGDPANRDVRVFNDLRFAATFRSGEVTEGDFAQIDHLVLHRSGMALIESKGVHGELHVDTRDQWQRRGRGRSENIPSPVAQVARQAVVLRELCRSEESGLLTRLAGLLQKSFRNFPMKTYVAISKDGRFVGATHQHEKCVVKVDQIVAAVSEELERHRKGTGIMGLVRGALGEDESDAGFFNLSDAEMNAIDAFLLAKHAPNARANPSAKPARLVTPSEGSTVLGAETSARRPALKQAGRADRIEALACGKCGSINVRVIYARDYCLKCEECGRFTPLAYVCPLCGKHATIRKDGPEYFRDCDGTGGCGRATVFSRE